MPPISQIQFSQSPSPLGPHSIIFHGRGELQDKAGLISPSKRNLIYPRYLHKLLVKQDLT